MSGASYGEARYDHIFPIPFSFIAPSHQRDPYPFYDQLRREAPVFKIPVPGFGGVDQYLVTGFEPMRAVLRGAAYSSHLSTRAIRGDFTPRPAREDEMRSIAVLDRPEHARVRRHVQGALTPQRADSLRERIERLADDLLDAAAARAKNDFIADVAAPLAIQVFADLFGVPPEDRAWLRASTDAIFSLAAGGEPAEQATRFQALARPILDYISGLLQERRRAPGGDLVSSLVLGQDDGDRLTEGELLGNCWLLLLAGYEPVVNLLGTGLLSLIRFPDQMERLRREPALLGSAIEEMLRYESPTQAIARITREDSELSGQRIARSSIVICALGAGNRDRAAFPSPEVFDIARSPNPHLGLGLGAHACVGAHLTRLQARAVFSRLLARFARIEIEADELDFRANPVSRGLRSLPLRLFAA